MLPKFPHRVDVHLRLAKVAKKRIGLSSANERLISSAPFWARPGAHEFEKPETNKKLAMNVIEGAQTQWAAEIMLASNKDGTRLFCLDYSKPKEVPVRDFYLTPCMSECIDSLAHATIF